MKWVLQEWWFSWEEFGWEAEGEVAFLEAIGVEATQGGDFPELFWKWAVGFGVFMDGAGCGCGGIDGFLVCTQAGAVAELGDEFGW